MSSPRLIAVQQPQATFHKDEGGKTNNLSFRVLLQGEIDLKVGGTKGEIPLDVKAVYEDGTVVPNQDEVIAVAGCTEKPTGGPCLCLISRLGGVLYRLKQVSKRLDDRPICVRVTLRGCPEVPPIQSQGTMVFSKRKNKSQREEQQAREREEMERREAEATSLLVKNIAVATTATDRPAKMVKFDTSSGATTMYDTTDTDECSSALGSSSMMDNLLRRISDLERTVQEQQRAIDELQKINLLQPPQLGRRSVSQVTWGINPSLGIGMAVPALRRDTSTESFSAFTLVEPEH